MSNEENILRAQLMPGRGSLLTEDQWTALAIRYEAGEKASKLAKEAEVSAGSFNWNMLRLGADPPNARVLSARAPGPTVVKRGEHQVRHFSADEDARLLELEKQGLNTNKIAQAIGRRWNSTRGRLMTLARIEARAEKV